MYDLRLVVYAPGGPRQGVLPHPVYVQAAWPLNDVPSLQVGYSAHAPAAGLLADPCEVAVEWSHDGTMWAEAPDSRFLRIRRRGDDTDVTGMARYDLPGYGWMLRKLVLYPGDAPLVDGKRPFTSATPGAIMQTFLAEGQARGTLPTLAWDFTPETDSAGQPWNKILTIYYQPGIDALTVLINLAEQGVCDFRTTGRTLQLFNEGGVLDRDLASGPSPVDLRYGRDIVAAPDEGTLEDVASAVLVVGEAGFRVSFTNPAATAPWGRWETYVGHGGVSDEGTATLLAESALRRAETERIQRTRQITLEQARWLPWQHYRPGDRILAPGDSGTAEPLRIRQLTLTRDQTGHVGGNLLLNDRFLDRAVRLARRTAGIVGGSTADGGSGARPAPEAPAPRIPAAPQGLIVDPQAYIDGAGFPRGQITAAWAPVAADIAGVALAVGGYELFMRVNEPGQPWFLVTATEAGDVSATYSPLEVGVEYAFKVRAVNLGARGPFSAIVSVVIPDDADAPPVPSPPVVSTRLGVVRVEWDGLSAGGTPMPSDLDRVLVWMQDPLDPGWSQVGYLQAAGSVVVPGLPYGADREFALSAVDRSGNASARSPSQVIAAVPLVAGDAAEGSITTGALAANAVTADKVAAGAVEAQHLAAQAVTADKLAAVLALATRLVAGDPGGARVELNDTGLQAFSPGGMQTVSISAASGAVSIIGQLATGATGNRIVVNPAGAVQPEIRFLPGTGLNPARMFVDGSMYPGEATILTYSGVNLTGTAQAQVIHAAADYRVQIVNPANGGLAGGGYLFAKPAELEVGYNDADANLQRFRFSAASTQFAGRWSFAGAEAGLIMRAVSLSGGSAYNVLWTFTMVSVPHVVFTADNPSPDRLGFWMRNPTTTGFELRSTENSVPTPFTVLLNMWAWRM